MYLELYRARDGWRMRLRGANHKILMSSAAYSSLRSLARTARRLVAECGSLTVRMRQ